MHSLDTINRLNREATDAYLERTRAKGKWIVATYTGLHIVAWSSYDFEHHARNAAADFNANPNKSPDTFHRVLAPTSFLNGLKRDQSEDRATPTIVVFTGDGRRHEGSAAALPGRLVEVAPEPQGKTRELTLGDVISRLERLEEAFLREHHGAKL